MKDISDFDVSRDNVLHVIDNWIFSRRDRQIFILRFLDGLTYEKIAEEMGMSPRQIKNIIYKRESVFFRELKKIGH